MVDSQEAISVQPDQIWEKYAGQIRDYTFFLTNVKTTPAEDFINRDLYQSLQRENLHELPRLREFFRSIVSTYEIETAFQNQENNPLSNQTIQAIILRAIGLRLDDIIKAKFIPEEKRQYEDYKLFYEQMIKGLKGLKNQANNRSLPKLTDSLSNLYCSAINQAYSRSLNLNLNPLSPAIDNFFNRNLKLHQTLLNTVPKQ